MSWQYLVEWCYSSPLVSLLRDWKYGAPAVQSVHLSGLTVLLSTVVILNFRLLGIGMRGLSLPVLASQLWRWAAGAMLLTICSGVVIFVLDPTRYLASGPFRLKMALLSLAIVYHFTVFRRVTRSEPGGRWRNIGVAFFSLTLWFGVGWAARAIAFF
jgi:hypothetical protein